MSTTSEEIEDLEQVAVRQLQTEQVYLYKGDNIGLYNVFDTMGITLTSDEDDEVEPVPVDWHLVNFNG